MRIDLSYLPALGAAFLLVFARTGTMLMLLPGLGEQNISTRMRLTFALVLAAMLLPLHRNAYHIDPGALAPTLVMLVEEILVGAMLGVTARLTISALEVAGSVIAQQLGLGFVTAVDPTQGRAGRNCRQFPHHARHHAVLRHRHASPRHCRAQRQLQSVRARRVAVFRRRGGADHQDSRRRLPHRHPDLRALFSSSDCCSISGSACWRG